MIDDELDELDTLEGYYGVEGYPYDESEVEEWLKRQDAEDN